MVYVINTSDFSERATCQLVGLSRVAFRRPHQCDISDDLDLALRARLRDYDRKHAIWGYQRSYTDARDDGWVVKHKKIQPLWAEVALPTAAKRCRKRFSVPTVVGGKANNGWSG